MRGRWRMRSASVAVMLAVVVPDAAGMRPAAAAPAPAPEVTTILAGGVGDGGPALEAQVNANAVTRDAMGNVYFYDRIAQSIRRVDAATGVVDQVFDAAAATVPGNDTYSIAERLQSWDMSMWVAGEAVYAGNGGLLYRIQDGHASTVPFVGSQERAHPDILFVRPDGALVVSWDRSYNGSGDGADTTELLPAGGGDPTILVPHESSAAAQSADGTVFLLAGDGLGIERVAPDLAVTRVAGFTGDEDVVVGAPAASSGMMANRLAVAPAGDQVVFSQMAPAGTEGAVYTFTVGGLIRRVTGPPTGAPFACATANSVVATADSVLIGCGGPVLSYPLEGAAPVQPGVPVAGLNGLGGYADSPPGTPASRAFLGNVRDTAADPTSGGRVAMATRNGVYALEGGALTRLLDETIGADPATVTQTERTDPGIDIDYGPDGTLYVFSRYAPGADEESWLVRSVDPAGAVRTVAGGGTAEPSTGVPATGVRLKPGQLAVGGDGKRLYLSQGRQRLLWSLDLASGHLLAPVALPSTVPYGSCETDWIGTDPAGPGVIGGTCGLRRYSASGPGSELVAGTGPTYAMATDGSAYWANRDGTALWRRTPAGAVVIAAGMTERREILGTALSYPLLASGGGNRVLLAERGPTARVRALAMPAASAWTAAIPKLALTPVSDGDLRYLKVEATLPAAPDAWHLRVRLAQDDGMLGPEWGPVVFDKHLTSSGGTQTMLVKALYSDLAYPSGNGLRVASTLRGVVYATVGDGTSAPPAVRAAAALPGYPTSLSIRATVRATTTPASTTLAFGDQVSIQGTLRDARDSAVLSAQRALLQVRRTGASTWSTLATVTSRSDGTVIHVLYSPLRTCAGISPLPARWRPAPAGSWRWQCGRT